jgi:hypothetical protein
MKRRREQRGTVYAKSGMWYVRYSDFRVTDGHLERKRLSNQLGAVDEMTKKQVYRRPPWGTARHVLGGNRQFDSSISLAEF